MTELNFPSRQYVFQLVMGGGAKIAAKPTSPPPNQVMFSHSVIALLLWVWRAAVILIFHKSPVTGQFAWTEEFTYCPGKRGFCAVEARSWRNSCEDGQGYKRLGAQRQGGWRK